MFEKGEVFSYFSQHEQTIAALWLEACRNGVGPWGASPPTWAPQLQLGNITYGFKQCYRVNRQERLLPRNETAHEVYLGPRARARAIVSSRATVFRGWSHSCLLIHGILSQ